MKIWMILLSYGFGIGFGIGFASTVQAAQLKGKRLDGSRYQGELTVSGKAPIRGKLRFKSGKSLEFVASNGVHVDLRVRPICAATVEEKLDGCWPHLKLDVDDGSSRTAELLIDTH